MTPDTVQVENGFATEEWFLAQLEAETLALDAMLDALAALGDKGRTRQLRDWSELLRETLAERADKDGMLRLMQVLPGALPSEALPCASVVEALKAVFKDRLGMAQVEAAFEGGVPAVEGVRRLATLHALTPGQFCHDKTWGFGVVKRVDDFYKKITIDFDGKRGHQMSFAYAAGTLDVIGPDHLLAVKHERGDELAALIAERPDEVVRMALRDYGPLPVALLQELLTDKVMPPERWKSFWDKARGILKDDPLVDIPVKRSESVRLLARAKDFGDGWFDGFGSERDPQRILERLDEWQAATGENPRAEAHRDLMAERLVFAIRGAESRRPELAARLLLKGVDLGLHGEGAAAFKLADQLEPLFGKARFLRVATALSTRDVLRLIELLQAENADRFSAMLLESLADLPAALIDACSRCLAAAGRESELLERVQAAFMARSLSGNMLLFICMRPDLLDTWRLGTRIDLMVQVIDWLGKPATGESLRVQKALRARIEDRDWLESLLTAMPGRDRAAVLERVARTRGWDEGSRRGVMGRMIKLFPDLETVAARTGDSAPTGRQGRFTSWRTYRARQEQLRVLVEVTIPENSREIGVARSYGDLRENFEYQAAKDQQGLLMRRKAELERDLGEVQGSDCSGGDTDTVGMGTLVVLERPDGTRESYWVLGEWDSDDALSIISRESALAKCLEGKRAGETVVLPDDRDDQPSRVVAVSGLNDAIKAWIAG